MVSLSTFEAMITFVIDSLCFAVFAAILTLPVFVIVRLSQLA